MSPHLKPLPLNDKRVVRITQDNAPCHIAGGIESETQTLYRTIKTYGGFFIRKRIAKVSAHTEPCKHCPSETDMRHRWLRPGIDPNTDRRSS